jgi:hypothetical protein
MSKVVNKFLHNIFRIKQIVSKAIINRNDAITPYTFENNIMEKGYVSITMSRLVFLSPLTIKFSKFGQVLLILRDQVYL